LNCGGVQAQVWDRSVAMYTFFSCTSISGLLVKSEMADPTSFVSVTWNLECRAFCEIVEKVCVHQAQEAVSMTNRWSAP
jgi:hypothetical protein